VAFADTALMEYKARIKQMPVEAVFRYSGGMRQFKGIEPKKGKALDAAKSGMEEAVETLKNMDSQLATLFNALSATDSNRPDDVNAEIEIANARNHIAETLTCQDFKALVI